MTRAARAAAAVGLLLLAAGSARAQAHNPFGVGISEGGGSATGLVGWMLAQQAGFERALAAAVRAAKVDGSALPWLATLSFAYGVFHAAGPGHGKVVMTSYLFANARALGRGLLLTLLAALCQGLVAVVLVGILALALHATAPRMKDAAAWTESASFAGVAALGAWLTLRKGLRLAQALRAPRLRFARAGGVARPTAVPAGAALALDRFGDACGCDPGPRFALAGAAHGPACGHAHGPDPSRLGSPVFSWTEEAFTVLAAGLRPCSGAILVLVFALAQGVFRAGIAAVLAMSLGTAVTTGAIAALAVLARGTAAKLAAPGTWAGTVAIRGFELAAALLILLAGVSLVLGYAAMNGA